MARKVLALLLCALVSKNVLAWTKVQSVAGNTTTSTMSVALTGVAMGNLLVIEVSAYANTSTAPAPTDSNGTVSTAVAATGEPLGAGDYSITGIFYVQNAASGAHTFSWSGLTSGYDYKATATEYSGAATTSVLDVTANNKGTGSALATLTSGTTTALSTASDLAVVSISIAAQVGSSNIAITDPPTGYTSLGSGSNTSTDIGWEQAYQFLSSSAAQSTTWNWTPDASTQYAAAAIATFKPASGGTVSSAPLWVIQP